MAGMVDPNQPTPQQPPLAQPQTAPAPAPTEDDSTLGLLAGGFRAGSAQLARAGVGLDAALLKTANSASGMLGPNNPVQQLTQEGLDRARTTAAALQAGSDAQNPEVQSQGWFNKGVGGFLQKAAFTAGEAAPQIAAAVAGGIGARAAGVAGAGMLTPEVAGALGPNAAASAGEQYEAADQKPGGASGADAVRSLALGGPIGFLQSMAPGDFLKSAVEGKTGDLVARVGSAALRDSAAGALGSGAQTAAEVLFDPTQSWADKARAIGESVVTGGAMSGLFGGALALHGADPKTVGDNQIKDLVDGTTGTDPHTGDPVPPGTGEGAEPPPIAEPEPIPEPGVNPNAQSYAATRLQGLGLDLAQTPQEFQDFIGNSTATNPAEFYNELLASQGAPVADTEPFQRASTQFGIGRDIDNEIQDHIAANPNAEAGGDGADHLATLRGLGALRDQASAIRDANAAEADENLVKPYERDLAPITQPMAAAGGTPATIGDRVADAAGVAKTQARNGKLGDFIRNASSDSLPDFLNNMRDAIDTNDPVTNSEGFTKMADHLGLTGDDGKPRDLTTEAAESPDDPRIQNLKELHDDADNIRNTTPGQDDPALKTNAATPTPDDGPRSIADRVMGTAREIAGDDGGKVSIGDLRKAMPDVAKDDFDNAVRQIDSDDTDNQLSQAPVGERAGRDGVKVGNKKMHDLEVAPNDDASPATPAERPPADTTAVTGGEVDDQGGNVAQYDHLAPQDPEQTVGASRDDLPAPESSPAYHEPDTVAESMISNAGSPTPADRIYQEGDDIPEIGPHMMQSAGPGGSDLYFNQAKHRLPLSGGRTMDHYADLGKPMRLADVLDWARGNAQNAQSLDWINNLKVSQLIKRMGLGDTRTYMLPGAAYDAASPYGYAASPGSDGMFRSAVNDQGQNVDHVLIRQHPTQISPQRLQQTITHEAVHAAFFHAVRSDWHTMEDVRAMLNHTQDMWDAQHPEYGGDPGSRTVAANGGHYGLTNPQEFIAEAFANPTFQKFLESVPVSRDLAKDLHIVGERATRNIGTMWDGFLYLVRRALGLSESDKNNTMLNTIMHYGQNLETAAADPSLQRPGQMGAAPPQVTPEVPPRTPQDSNEVAQRTMGIASTIAKKLDDSPIDGLKDKSLGGLLFFKSTNGIARSFGHLFPDGTLGRAGGQGGNWLRRNFDLASMGRTVQSQIGELYHGATQQLADISRASPKLAGAIQQVAFDATRLGFNYSKAWADHTWLRNAPNAADLKATFTKNLQILNKMQQNFDGQAPGTGLKAYNDLAAAGRLSWFSDKATLLSNFMRLVYPDAHITDRGNIAQEYNQKFAGLANVKNSTMFWAEQYMHHMQAAKAYTAKLTADSTDLSMTQQQRDAAKVQLNGSKPLMDMVNRLDGAFKSDLQQGTYFHLGRAGDFAASFHVPVGADGFADRATIGMMQKEMEAKGFGDVGLDATNGSSQIFTKFRSLAEAKAFGGLLQGWKQKGWLDNDPEKAPWVGRTTEGELFKANGGIPFIKAALDKVRDSNAFESDDHRNAFIADLGQTMLDLAPELNLNQFDAARHNVQGYSRDLVNNMNYRFAASASNLGKSATSLDRMNNYINMKNQIGQAALSGKSGFDVSKQSTMKQVLTEMQRRDASSQIRVPQSWLDSVKQANHAYNLAASASYVMLQFSQLPTLAIPEMGRVYGHAQSMAAMARVLPAAFRVLTEANSWSKGLDVEKLQAMKGLSQAWKDHILELASRGKMEVGSFTQAMSGDSPLEHITGPISNAIRMGNASALQAEVATRLVVGLAAKHLTEQYAGKQQFGPTSRFESPGAYAGHVLDESMMPWGSFDTPRAFSRNGLLRGMSPIVFQFHQFQLKLGEKLMTEIHNGFVSKGIDKAESQKFLMGHIAMATMLSGTLGLPAAGLVAGVATRMSDLWNGGEGFDMQSEYRNFLANAFGKTMGEVIAHGLPRYFGTDLSSWGDGELAPFTKLIGDRRKWEDSFPDYLAHAWGSAGSGLSNMVLAGRDMYNGRPLEAAARALPTSIRNLVRAYKLTTQGYVNAEGEKMPLKADALSVLQQAIGMTPANYAEYQEAHETQEGAMQAREYRSGVIKANLAKAYLQGDGGGQAHWLQQAQAYDRDPRHAADPIMAQMNDYLANQQRAMAYSQASGQPLGASPRNLPALRLTDWYRGQNQ